ncbi:MAG: hypothetical protein IKP89_01165, partial [Bacteroidales bacterium]|nr:hypothetical protein [Bacteroidales bacterium]
MRSIIPAVSGFESSSGLGATGGKGIGWRTSGSGATGTGLGKGYLYYGVTATVGYIKVYDT